MRRAQQHLENEGSDMMSTGELANFTADGRGNDAGGDESGDCKMVRSAAGRGDSDRTREK